MKKGIWSKALLSILALGFFILLSQFSRGDFQCSFVQSATCASGARLIGVENDSKGFNNAHAQNNSFATYNYSICCNDTINSSIVVSSVCPGDVTVVKLSGPDGNNAHVETGNNTNYSISACLDSNWKGISCRYNASSCDPGYSCVMSLASSEGRNDTNAHVGNCSQYSQKVCCAFANSAPTAPVPNYPVHNNITVFERRPNFNWTASTDADGNPITYLLNASCGGCSCQNIGASGISGTNYTPPTPLCVDYVYNWTVTACDNYGDCTLSALRNFTIKSVADLILTVNSSNFGAMSVGQNKNTLTNDPAALVGRNNGNVLLNTTINATSLFSTVAFDTIYYQFMANVSEANSLNLGCSQTTFRNMNASQRNLFCNMSYVDSSDEARIDLNITVPSGEGAGAKSSNIEVNFVMAGAG